MAQLGPASTTSSPRYKGRGRLLTPRPPKPMSPLLTSHCHSWCVSRQFPQRPPCSLAISRRSTIPPRPLSSFLDPSSPKQQPQQLHLRVKPEDPSPLTCSRTAFPSKDLYQVNIITPIPLEEPRRTRSSTAICEVLAVVPCEVEIGTQDNAKHRNSKHRRRLTIFIPPRLLPP